MNKPLVGDLRPPRQARRPVVLTLLEHYLPGHKAGGPIRSLEQLVAALGGSYRFRIVTNDRDIGDASRFADVRASRWYRRNGAAVLYLPPGLKRFIDLIGVLRSGDYDILYVNSFFARFSSMLPVALVRFGFVPKRPIVIAPRGEFSPGARAIKPTRKSLFLRLASFVRLYDDPSIRWQASTDLEAQDIRRALGPRAIEVARPVGPFAGGHVSADPVPALGDLPPRDATTTDAAPELRVVFLSRVSRKKNLAHALALVSRLRCPATLEIFGPVEDRRYWAACQRAMQHLPVHVRAEYRGEVPHDRVAEVFARHDVFLFPTLGESYGHVIQESLLAGCPVLTSDQTPWTGLDAHGAGWALPLEREQAFVDALERCAAMDATERLALRTRARAFGRQSADPEEPTVQHRRLFDAAARSRR